MALTTGLNPERARADINNFQNEYFAAISKCDDALEAFLDLLEINWASPKAVEFYQRFADRLSETFYSKPTEEGNKIVEGAIEAFNSISSANGGSTISDFGMMGVGAGSHEFKEEIDGDVGMNIANVSTAIPEFKQGVESGLNDLANVPKQIAFYDPAGEQAATYETGIIRVHDYIDQTVNTLISIVNTAIAEEQDNINLGKQGAVDAMEYNAPTS